jgi:hypothetical protein
MNPYPEERSVLVADNCVAGIHHNEALVELVESAGLMSDHLSRYLTDTPGCLILYLPPCRQI